MSHVIGYIAPIAVHLVWGASLFIFIYYYSLLHIKTLITRIILIVIIVVLTLMFLWSFWETILTKNDDILDVYNLSDEEFTSVMSVRNEERRSTMLVNIIVKRGLMVYMCSEQGRVRFCTTCRHIKPDRAHHCSTCDTCILKMDHHCPWVNNCVGYRNYKMFFQALLYGTLYCFFYVCCTIDVFIAFCTGKFDDLDYILVALGFIVALIIGTVISIFTVYHLHLIMSNKTTVESVQTPCFVEDEVQVSFDLGTKRNMASVFGGNCCYWFIPVFSSRGDGHTFEMEEISSV